jgi:hypothetical protein
MSDAEKLAHAIADYDFEHGDLLCLKFGGDGDNGEALIEALAHVLANQESPPCSPASCEVWKERQRFHRAIRELMYECNAELPRVYTFEDTLRDLKELLAPKESSLKGFDERLVRELIEHVRDTRMYYRPGDDEATTIHLDELAGLTKAVEASYREETDENAASDGGCEQWAGEIKRQAYKLAREYADALYPQGHNKHHQMYLAFRAGADSMIRVAEAALKAESPLSSSADGESLKEKFTFSLSFGTSAVHTRGTPLNVVINGQELTQAEAIEAFMKLWAKPNQDAVSVTLTTSDESGKPAKPLVSPTSGYCLDADGKMMRISDINKEGGKDD